MQQRFTDLLKEILEIGDRELELKDEFRDYPEWDSLGYLELIAMLDEEYGVAIENDDFGVDELRGSRIIVIKSELEHNDVIHTKNQFQKFLESSF